MNLNGHFAPEQNAPRKALRVLLAGALATMTVMGMGMKSASAGSVTQPGETVGLATGAPLPPGWYAVDTLDYGQISGTPRVDVGVNIPVVAWSTPWQLLGARVQALAAAPEVEVGTPSSHVAGIYNPFFAGQLAWDLGNGVGASYLLGVYPGVSSPVADRSTSINQRFGLSYTADGYNLTANAIYGTQLSSKTNPDYINLDLTATKNFGKWTLGPVGYYSTDLSTPSAGYKKQTQFALGGLVGYNFGPVIMQSYLTRVVSQTNYGGEDTRFWFRLIVPIS